MPEAMRLDRLLYFLRFAKSRSAAQGLASSGFVRCNRCRVVRPSAPIAIGDVLTFPFGRSIKVIRVLAIPARRGPAREAATCYDMLDDQPKNAIAAQQLTPEKGTVTP